ncbi:unnamed protein product [Caenorhabditis sp. 36 PRJEB53466]|nr:unnamed protein product [Caenorhabditis sp. 36 PRJEB53466]
MPKGGASSLTPVYAGLQEDLDAFLKAFLDLKTRKFSDYKNMFAHRGMIQMYNGRSNSAEIIEFNEYILVYCLPYMEEFVCPGSPRTLEERLFGLYSLYTFFYVQAPNHVVKIRMDPDAARTFQRFTQFLLNEKLYDAYMCCLKLLEDKAIKHVAFIPIYDPSCFKRYYTDNKVSGVSVRTNVNDPMSKLKVLVESPLFAKLSVVHKQYMKLKTDLNVQAVPGMAAMKDPRELARGIVEQSIRNAEIKTGVEMMITSDHTIEHLGSRGMLRSEIKERAYAADLNLTRFRRHRTTTPLSMSTETFGFSENKPLDAAKIEDSDVQILEEVAPKRRGRRALPKKRGRRPLSAIPPPKREKVEPIRVPIKLTKSQAERLRNSSTKTVEDIFCSEDFEDDKEPMEKEPKKEVKRKEKVSKVKRPAKPVKIKKEKKGPVEPRGSRSSLRLRKMDPDPFVDELPARNTSSKKSVKKEKQVQVKVEVKDKKNLEILEEPQRSQDLDWTFEVAELPQKKDEVPHLISKETLETEVVVIQNCPKSILKTRKSDVSRHVGFHEDMNGRVNTSILEISPRIDFGNSSGEECEQLQVDIRKDEEDDEEEVVLPIPQPILQENPQKETADEERIDENDIFFPIENEELLAVDSDDAFEISFDED